MSSENTEQGQVISVGSIGGLGGPSPLAKPKEAVNHPDHYGGAENPYEVIKVLKSWLTYDEYCGFLKGNVIKYLARAKKKNGTEDLAKATWYQRELDAYTKEYIG